MAANGQGAASVAAGGGVGSGGGEARRYWATEAQCPGMGATATPAQPHKRPRTVGGAGGSNSEEMAAIWAELAIMKDVTLAVGALTLETKQEVREEKGYSLMTALVNPELEWVLAGLAEGKVYSELVKTHKGEDVGPAHIRIMLKVMEIMIAKANSPEEGAILMAWWDKYIHEQDHHNIAYEVHNFSIKKPTIPKSKKWGEGEYAKITWKFKSEFHETLSKLLASNGAKVQMGTAPRQYLERQAKEKLDSFKQT
jgi:hypothetical protein